MKVTRYNNINEYNGKEHFVVIGTLAEYLACNIDEYKCTEVNAVGDLLLEIAWREVAGLNPRLYGPAFRYEIRNPQTGYIEITFYRRN